MSGPVPAGPGPHCGVGPAWVLGLFGAQTPSQGARWSAKRHSLSRLSQVARAPYCALLSPQPRPRRWKGHSVARAAVRPAAPVRLGRGGEPPGLISRTGVFACSRARQAPAPGSMPDPHDDTNVPSGSTDGAQMESTSSPVPREHGDHRQEDEGSPAPTSSSSAPTAARTLDTAATEEPSFTVEAATPAARLQSPTPPSARPEARGSPGQQVFRMAFDGEGRPTPSPFNGSVSRMEVDDTRAEDQTCHPNDETGHFVARAAVRPAAPSPPRCIEGAGRPV